MNLGSLVIIFPKFPILPILPIFPILSAVLAVPITLSSLLTTHYSFDSLSHQALAVLPTLPTPVMLSEAKHLSVSTD